MRTLSLFLTLSLSSAFAQLDSNSITVTASRSPGNGRPDQTIYSVQIYAGLETGLDDVLAALQSLGISAASFQTLSALSSGSPPMPTLDWSFQLVAPFAKNKDTITALANLQQTIEKKKNGMSMSFYIVGTQPSAPQSCSQSDLIADARAQAQKLADGAGVNVGNILAISSATASNGSSLQQWFNTTPCALTVKFALLRY